MANESALPGYKPLYQQVKEGLTRRLIDGSWMPGQMIPSEIELAREIGVSQGTVRKALDDMTSEHLLVRRQGRGTYVAIPEDGRILFQFFRLFPDSGQRDFPQSRIISRKAGKATRTEAAMLELAPGAPVHRVERMRHFARTPLMVETLVLPAVYFEGFEALDEVPNNVYRLYSEKWGITIARASEQLKAQTATPADARHLGLAPGTALLAIRRIAHDLENRPVELRLSRCDTSAAHYAAELR